MTSLPVLRGLPRDAGAVCASCCHHIYSQAAGEHMCVATKIRKIDPVTGRFIVEGLAFCEERNRAGACPLYITTWWRRAASWLNRHWHAPTTTVPDRETAPADSDVWPSSTTMPYRASE